MKNIIEYVWLDANNNIRMKTKIVDSFLDITLDKLDLWNFDGSSTGQSNGVNSDVILKPIRLYKNNTHKYIALCECYNKDMTPHISNTRHSCFNMHNKCDEYKFLFGIEQEYVIFENNNKPYKWVSCNNPSLDENMNKQCEYYCSVGSNKAFGRNISNDHLELCLDYNVNICGTNAEVAPSQWEFQIGTCDPLLVSDDLIVARYLLSLVAEKYDCYISYDPKPYGPNWNGSGGHTNVSTIKMRVKNGLTEISKACDKLKKTHDEHMLVYGKNNHLRLTGIHETCNMNLFTYGVADRGASVRIPLQVYNNGCGYLEDRRPAANLDPYIVTCTLMKTLIKN